MVKKDSSSNIITKSCLTKVETFLFGMSTTNPLRAHFHSDGRNRANLHLANPHSASSAPPTPGKAGTSASSAPPTPGKAGTSASSAPPTPGKAGTSASSAPPTPGKAGTSASSAPPTPGKAGTSASSAPPTPGKAGTSASSAPPTPGKAGTSASSAPPTPGKAGTSASSAPPTPGKAGTSASSAPPTPGKAGTSASSAPPTPGKAGTSASSAPPTPGKAGTSASSAPPTPGKAGTSASSAPPTPGKAGTSASSAPPTPGKAGTSASSAPPTPGKAGTSASSAPPTPGKAGTSASSAPPTPGKAGTSASSAPPTPGKAGTSASSAPPTPGKAGTSASSAPPTPGKAGTSVPSTPPTTKEAGTSASSAPPTPGKAGTSVPSTPPTTEEAGTSASSAPPTPGKAGTSEPSTSPSPEEGGPSASSAPPTPGKAGTSVPSTPPTTIEAETSASSAPPTPGKAGTSASSAPPTPGKAGTSELSTSPTPEEGGPSELSTSPTPEEGASLAPPTPEEAGTSETNLFVSEQPTPPTPEVAGPSDPSITTTPEEAGPSGKYQYFVSNFRLVSSPAPPTPEEAGPSEPTTSPTPEEEGPSEQPTPETLFQSESPTPEIKSGPSTSPTRQEEGSSGPSTPLTPEETGPSGPSTSPTRQEEGSSGPSTPLTPEETGPSDLSTTKVSESGGPSVILHPGPLYYCTTMSQSQLSEMFPILRSASPSCRPGECGTWGKGAYKCLNGQTFYCKSKSTMSYCRHCVESGAEFNIETKRNEYGNLEKMKIKIDGNEVDISGMDITVNSIMIRVPYMNKILRIQKCGMYTKLISRRDILSLVWDYKQLLCLNLIKKYRTCGLCGDSQGGPGEDLLAFIEGNIIEKDGETKIETSDPNEDGIKYCNSIISYYFSSVVYGSTSQNDYIKICAYEYNECAEKDKRMCACSTFIELARICGNAGCSDLLKSWRKDPNILCGVPQCPETQVYDECAPVSQPTCSNPSPFQEKGVVSGCTCPEGLVIDDMGGSMSCIPKSGCPCSYGGRLYQLGETRQSTCNSECTCAGGIWHCSEGRCPGICKVEEGLFITTYDGKTFSLNGNCNYVVSHGDDWIVSAEISQTLNAQSKTSLNSITLVLNLGREESKFTFKNDGHILNDNMKSQNYYESDQIQILRFSEYIVIKTYFGLNIVIQAGLVMQVYIYLSTPGFENTKGLCGSYNFKADDDFMSNQNILESVPDAFAHSWKLSTCPDPSPPTCVNLDKEIFADQHCSQVKDPNGPFASCHFAVDYRPFVERCVLSTCMGDDIIIGLCTALGNYAMACAESGVLLSNWRSEMCRKECKNNQVLQYNHVSCYSTCQSVSPPKNDCKGQDLLIEACGCPDGLYLNSQEFCVPRVDCDCHLGYDILEAHALIEINGNSCNCSEGRIICVPQGDEMPEICTGGAQFVDCSYPDLQRRVDLECSTRNLPRIHKDGDCKPGCYCPISMVRNSKGDCVPPTECPCIFGGEEYENGSSVMISCNLCECNRGVWACTEHDCQSSCHVYGDGHFRTFDGKWYSYDGLCQYTIVEDFCNSGDGTFRILAQSVPCCEDGLTCARKIVISLQGVNIILQDGKTKTVNSETVDCAGNKLTSSFFVNTVGLYVIVSISNGVSVIWDGNTRISVLLDPHWSGKVCGLCGNNNGDLKDDFKARDGSVVVETLKFGNSWKVDPFCLDTETQVYPCDANAYCKSWALRKCQLIKEATFKDCHHKVDPAPYYEACLQEACVCEMEGKYLGFCTTVAMYAEACTAAGVCVQWRSPVLCPVYCDYYNARGENIWHYEACGSAQNKTCNNQAIGQRFSSLLEGCYATCPDSAPYLDENTMKCVNLSECTCYNNGDILPANSVIVDECGKFCRCISGNVICSETPYDSPETPHGVTETPYDSPETPYGGPGYTGVVTETTYGGPKTTYGGPSMLPQ
ncbi:mucin-19-like [Spea bombifrons]|uniref:mucin-19-like n=1 Tax=Spea bombifrons TaxID=233779 RepID=UPI00234A13D8|nr:mucin-19-like [Spea bombifrons]